MKEITLKIDDNVYRELKSSQSVRIMTGSAYGIQDAFITKLITSIDKGEKEVEMKFKEKE